MTEPSHPLDTIATCTTADASDIVGGGDVIASGGTVIATAFGSIPPTDWLVSDLDPDERLNALSGFFELEIGRVLHGGHGYVDHIWDRAFAVWESAGPDLVYNPLPDYDQWLRIACGKATPKFEALGRSFAGHHPTQTPYEHLVFLAVRPEHQHKGLGGRLLRHRLDRFDEQGRSAFLETTTDANVKWYERYGFHVFGGSDQAPDLAPYTGPDGSTLISPLWRAPKT